MIAITNIGVTGNKVNVISVIPLEYIDPAHVFSEDAANILAEHRLHYLQLDTTGTPPFRPFYNLF